MSWEYQNGNYKVTIDDEGTKIRHSDNPIPEWPESMDIKVTNDCDGGCAYCHEMSVPGGARFNPINFCRLVAPLPDGIELAIGGGNPLTCLNDFAELRDYVDLNGLIMNMTINAKHLHRVKPGDLDRFTAIGISYHPRLHEQIKKFYAEFGHKHQIVIHLIAGVHTLHDLGMCLGDFKKVLVLGYKKVGRGIKFNQKTIDTKISEWERGIGEYIGWADTVLAFDNLAITQLDIRRFFSDEKWSQFYMGNDGQFSMYMDLVKMEYARSSTSSDRFPIGDMTIKEMFKHVRSL